MEPTLFYVGLYFLVSLLHLASSRVDSYNGWKNSPNVQYHIQTDEGEERYFKYQTKSGQYRKEKRLQDGTVVGTYGWVDPNGYLRLRDYIADNQGYRILKTKMIYVGGNSIGGDTTPGSFHTKYTPLPSVTYQLPLESQPHRFNAYVPPSPNTYVPPSANPYLPPYYSQTTPATTAYVTSSTSVNPLVSYPGYYSTSTPVVDVSLNSVPKSSTTAYASSTPTPVYITSTPSYATSTPSYASSTPAYASTTPSPSVAIFNDPSPSPIAVYASTPKPIGVNYVSTPAPVTEPSREVEPAYSTTPSPIQHTTPSAIPAIGVTSTSPPPPPPPVAGKFAFFDRNNNFITETEKNKLFYQNEGKTNYDFGNYYRRNYEGNDNYYTTKGYVDYSNNFQEYDGIATVQNGFRYYLPRHYHEEQSSSGGQERTGSFGYIDPFGIRRVIYYNTAPGRGFVHRKNNRYVGFHATPYDPRPNF